MFRFGSGFSVEFRRYAQPPLVRHDHDRRPIPLEFLRQALDQVDPVPVGHLLLVVALADDQDVRCVRPQQFGGFLNQKVEVVLAAVLGEKCFF